jgi:type IV pilus assembly protein PilW
MKIETSGFGLIEILVGLVIGLITIMVIGQVTAVFEGQKRSSTGGSDAQTNGMLALSAIAHDMTMAGNGLVVPSLGGATGNLLCPLGTNIYYGGTVRSQPSDAYGGLVAPVRILDGGAGPDSIIVMRSDAEFGHLTMPVRSFNAGASPPALTVDAWPDSATSPTPGQVFLLGKTDGSKVCTLYQVSNATQPIAGAAGWSIEFSSGAGYPYSAPNTAVFPGFPASGYGDGDVIINLGSSVNYNAATKEGNLTVNRAGFVFRQYGVQCGKLAAVDPSQVVGPYDCTNTSPQVDEIVDLEAQYGIAAAGTQNVVEWRDANGTWAPTALTAANIARIKAIRIAVVSRSPQYEKVDPTLYPPTGYVSPATITLWTAFPGSDPAPVFVVPDRQYRYKVFTTVVPIKDVVWGQL